MKSRLLDRGREQMLIYPITRAEDSRGNMHETPSKVPVKIRVTVTEGRGSDAELPGQVTSAVLRCTSRRAPVASWARIVFRGEEWDVAAPPVFSPGASSATKHVEFDIRSRNTSIKSMEV